MQSHNKYLLKNLLITTIFITVALTLIVWLVQSLRFVDLIVNRGVGIGDFLYMTMLLLPSFIGIVLPVSLFCALLYTYYRLSLDRELITLQNAGLSPLQLSYLPLSLAILVVIIGYIISLYLLPVSYGKFRDQQLNFRNNNATSLLQEGQFFSPVDGITIYIRARDRNQNLYGILVHDNRDRQKPRTVMAEKGAMLKSKDGGSYLSLLNGNYQEVIRDDGKLSMVNFTSHILDIGNYIGNDDLDNPTRYKKDKERFLGELLNPEAELPDKKRQKLKSKAHQRLTWPLYSLALTFIALAAMFYGEFNRRNEWRRPAIAAISGTIFMIIALLTQNLSAKIALFMPIMYLFPLGLFAACLWIIYNNGQLRAKIN